MPDKLLILCCHATFRAHLGQSPFDEKVWSLKPYQIGDYDRPSEHTTFITHIKAAIDSYFHDDSQVLVISGGKTTDDELSESESYYAVIDTLGLLPDDSDTGLVVHENHSTDSYQNLLFSLIEYYKLAESWPSRITLITHAFKFDRFVENHAAAIHWPVDRISVMGLNAPMSKTDMDTVQDAERHTRDAFAKDPYGVQPFLMEKKRSRHWDEACIDELLAGIKDARVVGQLRELLVWRGGKDGTELFPGVTPWNDVCGYSA